MALKAFAIFVFFTVGSVVVAYIASQFDVNTVFHREQPPPKFTGPLAVNKDLDRAEKILKGLIDGPEAIAFYKGDLYTSLNNGTILKISGDKVTVVGHTGKPETCGQVYNEDLCGRPLGIRFGHKDDLYIADSYYGVLRMNVSTGKVDTLFDAKTSKVNDKWAKMTDDLDITKEGDIYFSDASSKWLIKEAMLDFMESAPNGRLLHYDPRTKKTEEILGDLHFPNGVQLSPDQSYLIFSETSRSRIMKYYLKGSKKGTVETFADNLPGFPDNIRSNGRGGYWVGLCGCRIPDKLNPLAMLSPFPMLRKMVLRLGFVPYWFLMQFERLVPNHYTKLILHYIPHLSLGRFVMPNYGLVLELDAEGRISRCFHSPTGNVKFISHLEEHEGSVYLGSPWNDYLAKLPLN